MLMLLLTNVLSLCFHRYITLCMRWSMECVTFVIIICLYVNLAAISLHSDFLSLNYLTRFIDWKADCASYIHIDIDALYWALINIFRHATDISLYIFAICIYNGQIYRTIHPSIISHRNKYPTSSIRYPCSAN